VAMSCRQDCVDALWAVPWFDATHMVRPKEMMFFHTYCPGCLSYYRGFLMSATGVSHGPGLERGHNGFTNI
jgi:hypothetical protein